MGNSDAAKKLSHFHGKWSYRIEHIKYLMVLSTCVAKTKVAFTRRTRWVALWPPGLRNRAAKDYVVGPLYCSLIGGVDDISAATVHLDLEKSLDPRYDYEIGEEQEEKFGSFGAGADENIPTSKFHAKNSRWQKMNLFHTQSFNIFKNKCSELETILNLHPN